MAELFSLLNRLPTARYQDNELNEMCNNALLLEKQEQSILALGCYSIEEILYGRYYWYTKFLCRYETLYGKNGSMEQIQFKIIEAMDYAGCVDCSLLKKIEQDLNYSD